MAFYKKQDHIQIIAEILCSCKSPQTKSSIRRQTNMSYAILQNCVMQLLLSHWLELVEDHYGQKNS